MYSADKLVILVAGTRIIKQFYKLTFIKWYKYEILEFLYRTVLNPSYFVLSVKVSLFGMCVLFHICHYNCKNNQSQLVTACLTLREINLPRIFCQRSVNSKKKYPLPLFLLFLHKACSLLNIMKERQTEKIPQSSSLAF